MEEKKKLRLALIGSNGIPANYGGTETFYEFLTKELSGKYDITVYCSNRQDELNLSICHCLLMAGKLFCMIRFQLLMLHSMLTSCFYLVHQLQR